jgi:hypothetical protein
LIRRSAELAAYNEVALTETTPVAAVCARYWFVSSENVPEADILTKESDEYDSPLSDDRLVGSVSACVCVEVVTELVVEVVIVDGVPRARPVWPELNARPVFAARVTSPVLVPLTLAVAATVRVEEAALKAIVPALVETVRPTLRVSVPVDQVGDPAPPDRSTWPEVPADMIP